MDRLIMGIILILGAIYFIGGYYSIASEEAERTKALTASTVKSKEEVASDFRTAVDHDVYQAEIGGQKFFLEFETENTGWTGAATFVLHDGCEFVYGYTLEDNTIEMTYIGNTCGAEGTDAIMYIKNNGSIATVMHGQEFVFSKN
ncbi:MAG: hypothetical protein ACOCXH_07780 [Cyclobacteriaceae bacterium]